LFFCLQQRCLHLQPTTTARHIQPRSGVLILIGAIWSGDLGRSMPFEIKISGHAL